MPRSVAVIGAGLAGATAALTLRDEGFEGAVILVGEEAEAPYERPPLSKEYLRGEQGLEAFLVRPREAYGRLGIELRLGERAERILPAEHTVVLARGRRVEADAVLLATGGRSRRLPIPGLGLDGVHDLRTLADADRLRAEARPGRRAVVVGMGFIGCEVAASLRTLGLEVVAVELAPVPLAHALGEQVGRAIAELHRRHGVELLLGDRVEVFEGGQRFERLRTAAGRVVEGDFAVVGLGLEPAADLARAAGAAVEDGVLVDSLCRTTVPGLYAAGDVARHDHRLAGRPIRVEHWRNALDQGAAAARSMLGSGQTYDPVHWFWSDQYDANLQFVGFHEDWDQLVVRGDVEAGAFTAFYLRGGVVRAGAALNQGREIRRAAALIRSGLAVDAASLGDPAIDLRTLVPGA